MTAELEKVLEHFETLRSVRGWCLHRDDEILLSRLPAPYGREQALAMGRVLRQLAQSLRSDGREPQQLQLSYRDGVMIAVRQQSGLHTLWLSFLLKDDSEVPIIAESAIAALSTLSAADGAIWLEPRQMACAALK